MTAFYWPQGIFKFKHSFVCNFYSNNILCIRYEMAHQLNPIFSSITLMLRSLCQKYGYKPPGQLGRLILIKLCFKWWNVPYPCPFIRFPNISPFCFNVLLSMTENKLLDHGVEQNCVLQHHAYIYKTTMNLTSHLKNHRHGNTMWGQLKIFMLQ